MVLECRPGIIFALFLCVSGVGTRAMANTDPTDPYSHVQELSKNVADGEPLYIAQGRWRTGIVALSAIEADPTKVTPHRHCYYQTKLRILLGQVSAGAKAQRECTISLVKAVKESDRLAEIINELAEGVYALQDRELSECRAQGKSSVKIVAMRVVEEFEKRGMILSWTGRARLERDLESFRDGGIGALSLASEIQVDWSKADWSKADWSKADWKGVSAAERAKAWAAWKDSPGGGIDPKLFGLDDGTRPWPNLVPKDKPDGL